MVVKDGVRDRKTITEFLKDDLSKDHSAGFGYYKAKKIADKLGMSPKEVGSNLKILADESCDLRITPHSYSKSTTWLVERADGTKSAM